MSLFVFLAGTSCGDEDYFDESKMQREPDMVIADRSGSLHYRKDAQMWAVSYHYPGTIDSVDDYLIPGFKNEKKFPTDVWPMPSVRISGSCHRTDEFFIPAGYEDYYIEITELVYE
jgi:hypothetical protein